MRKTTVTKVKRESLLSAIIEYPDRTSAELSILTAIPVTHVRQQLVYLKAEGLVRVSGEVRGAANPQHKVRATMLGRLVHFIRWWKYGMPVRKMLYGLRA